MDNLPDSSPPLKIKKYPNRRFYDATRSCNVTLADLHDLIGQGHEVVVTDSASGQDITNLILTQIIMEHDPPKLDFFPPNILHQVIRTQQKMLGNVAVQFFRQTIETQKVSQEQWSRFVQSAFGGMPWMNPAPLDWTRTMMSAFMPVAQSQTAGERTQPGSKPSTDSPADAELAELREQLRSLMKRVEGFEQGKPES